MTSQTQPRSTAGAHAPPSPVRRSLSLERLFVEKLYQQIGRPAIQIVLWDGTVIGDHAAPIGRAVIHQPRVLRRLLVSPILSFGEAFAANELTIEGDLIQTLVEMNRGLTRATTPQFWPTFFSRNVPRNTFAASKRRVYHHYDIGNDFYKLWLDKQLVYTCAYYADQHATLEAAQTAKLDYVCTKLRLKPGDKVIEAGCGWGALALHMARHYGVSVRAFNLSREQVAYARNRAQEEGLSDQVEFIEDDYRNITGQSDAFVSVGMLEHVGPDSYRTLGEVIGRVLTPEGRGLIHSIGRNIAKPLDPWTVKYIFPGAYAPSLREMMDIFEDGGFSVLDVENLRLHYARTCSDWLALYETATDQVRAMFDDNFVRMWRLYLASSSATFLSGDLQLFQVVFARSANNSLPITRADWYL
ncbi:MAG: cyclopropane fatty acid synthase [Planctomycetaceae bacterium]|nr:cyclopropane fatty acid synthase [Planctomycetaceae bacterium]